LPPAQRWQALVRHIVKNILEASRPPTTLAPALAPS
jgi:hypothetical protein